MSFWIPAYAGMTHGGRKDTGASPHPARRPVSQREEAILGESTVGVSSGGLVLRKKMACPGRDIPKCGFSFSSGGQCYGGYGARVLARS